jgi:hypothetical protein
MAIRTCGYTALGEHAFESSNPRREFCSSRCRKKARRRADEEPFVMAGLPPAWCKCTPRSLLGPEHRCLLCGHCPRWVVPVYEVTSDAARAFYVTTTTRMTSGVTVYR